MANLNRHLCYLSSPKQHYHPCSIDDKNFASCTGIDDNCVVISTNSLHSIRLFYAAYFASMGLLLPYFPVYLKHLGLNELWVGILVAILAAAKIFSPPLAGLLIERYQLNTRRFLWLTACLSTIAAAALLLNLSLTWMMLSVFLFGLLWASILPLTDGVSLIVAEVSMIHYGRLRVWGSLGFVLASLLGGWYMVGENITHFPWILCALLCVATFAAIGFPNLNDLKHHPSQQQPSKRNPQALKWLLFTGFCMQASHGAYYGFFSLYMLDAGYSGSEIGLFWMLGVLAEIILMWYWSKPIQQVSPVWLLGLCLLLAALRWLGLALTTSMFAIILLQLLHAASFAAFHIAAVAWVRNFAGQSRQTSAQGWYSAIGFGLGSTLGILLCAYIVQHYGYAQAFLTCAGFALLGFSGIWQLQRATRSKT
ncbi:MAG: MFS transporter [Mariprofundaceae bacterium]|nr:MFS transporter [Mariprofundaceae bacterium]